ncbi:helix-turn-helix domain-containing protein [Salmonella enterica]|nr:helix-turn-helix domain-containing protein [Salmonella enterica]EHJ8971134.1 helix-turn-helix domain-containing protein [Salmonella enterica]
MSISSRDYSQKLRKVRKAEGLTQKEFADLTGLSLSTIRNYESGQKTARAEIMESVLQVQLFEKYTMWLLHDKTFPQAGQIAPALSLDGAEELADVQASTKTTPKSSRSRRNAG